MTSVIKNGDKLYPELFLEKSLCDKMINMHKKKHFKKIREQLMPLAWHLKIR